MTTRGFTNIGTQQVDEVDEYINLLAEHERRLKFHKFRDYVPYEKQAEWLGMMCKVKALFGANRVGKTLTAAFEVVCHLTGRYPDWWKGRKFFHAVQVRCIAINFEQMRKVMQVELLGDVAHAMGSGMIPKELIVDHTMRVGLQDTVDTVWVQHVSGEISSCELMSNVQGREAMQGDHKHVIWIDEECDWDVFVENKLRTAGTGDKASGIIIVTFTPLKGWTDLVTWILRETDKSMVKHITIGWDDVPHLTAEEKAGLIAGLLPHEIEARSKGIPTMASGLIYPIDLKTLLVRPFDIESYNPGLIGLDVAPVGTTAGALLIRDLASKVTYLTMEHYSTAVSTAVHVAGIKARMGRYPVRLDPSSHRRGDLDSINLLHEYEACFGEGWDIADAYNPVYSGISRLWAAMEEGRFKVFNNCAHWIEEHQNYIWDEKKKTVDGHPVPRKQKDHLMDATRYGFWGVDVEGAALALDFRPRAQAPTWQPLDRETGY